MCLKYKLKPTYLYIFKAKKQMNYMWDERWKMIQLKSYRIASIST